MTKFYLFVAAFLTLSAVSFGQTCPANSDPSQPHRWPTHSKWFFGQNQMLDFGAGGTGAPTVSTITGAGAPYTAYESCAAAADEAGNLVFYTNGVGLWDGTGAAITIPDNGGRLLTGAENAGGNAGSAVQGVLIVKHPLDLDRYFIFTTDDVIGGNNNGITNGFNYYIYTRSTNTVSGATRLGGYRSTEQVSATWHNNGVDIWIASHEATINSPSSNYHAYLLGCNGLTTAPVTSSAGFAVQSNTAGWGGYANERASLEFANADPTTRNITAAATHHCGGGTWDPVNSVSILSFDNLTGIFTHTRALGDGSVAHSNPYDCEFSPDGTKLFVTFQSDGAALNGRLGYFPVAGGAFTEVVNTADVNIDIGQIELAGDGNIYGGGFDKNPWGYLDGLTRISTGAAPAGSVGAFNTANNAAGYGVSNRFIPPSDWVEIQDPGALTECDLPYNFSTQWLCKGTDAENTPLYENAYSMDIPCATCTIDPITGVFNSTAPGTFRIRFDICTISDTLTFTVGTCGCSTDVSPGPVEVCEGTNVALDPLLVSSSGAGVWTVDSVPTGAGAAATITNDGTDTTFNAPVGTIPGIYKVMFNVTGGACEDSIYIRVNKTPVVTVNDSAICVGGAAALFTATTDSTVTSHAWSVNGTGTAATTSGTTAGAYTVVVIDENSCTSTATGTLTENALPTVTVNDAAICDGDPAATFTATSATATEWLWSVNGTGTTNSTTGTTAGAYTVEVTDANTCTATATGTLTVNTLPTVTVNDAAICAGDPAATFTATSATATGWVWSDNGTGTANTTTGTAAGGYTVVVTDANTCTATATGTLTVNPLPVVTVNAATICAGDPAATFTATSATAIGWVWSDQGTGTAQTTTGTTAGNYIVQVTDANNCTANSLGILTVNPLPTVSVNDSTICAGETALFTATTTATVTGYLWSNEGTGTASTTTGTNAGTYTCTITDDNNCTATDDGTLTVIPLPTPAITAMGPYCANDDAVAMAGTPTGGTVTGVWKINDVVNAAASFDPGAAVVGNNTVRYIATENNCTDSTDITVIVNANKDASLSDSIIDACVFDPNPTLTVVEVGGTWSDPAVTMAGNTATIDLAALAAANIAGGGTGAINDLVITYTQADPCGDVDQIVVSTTTALDATITQAGPYCESDNTEYTLTAEDAGGTWSGNGITDATLGTFNPSIATAAGSPHTITYTIPGNCGDVKTMDIVVDAQPDATISGASNLCINASSITLSVPANSGTSVGTWTETPSTNGGFNTTTLEFNPSTATAGSYVLSYGVVDGTCNAADQVTIVVVDTPIFTIDPIGPFCSGDAAVPLTITPNNYPGGTWSGTGVSGTNFDPGSASTTGANAVSYAASVTSDGQTCTATQTIDVIVEEQATTTMPADFGMCSADAATSVVPLTSTPATTVGSYVASCGACYDATTNMFDPVIAGVGPHTITYSVGTNCAASDATTITVTQAAVITPVSPVDRCVGDVTTPSTFSATVGTATGTGVWTLDAPALGSIDASTGVWSGAGVTTGGTVSATYTFTTTDPAPNGCVSDETITMEVFDNPVIDFSRSNEDSCVAYADVFTDNTSYPQSTLSGSTWDFGNGSTGTNQGSDGTNYTVAGDYTVTLSNAYANGCKATASMTVSVFPLPNADFTWSPNPASVLDPRIQFVNSGDLTDEYLWDFTSKGSPSTSTSDGPSTVFNVLSDDTIPVTLIVTNNFVTNNSTTVGCTDTVVKNVIIQDIFQVYVPNAFTPAAKSDGLNDTFYPQGRNWALDNFEFVVLDRWGNLIFETTTIGHGWDGTVDGSASSGKLSQNDVYVWKLTVKNMYTGKIYRKVGTVTLVK